MSDENTGQENKNIVESKVETIGPTMQLLLDEFVIKNQCTFDDCKIYLYKYEGYFSGEKKALVTTFHGQEPPDESEIGYKYGSGRYQIMIFPPYQSGKRLKPDAKAYTFRLSKTYDNIKNDIANQPTQSQQPTIINSGGGGLKETLSLIQSVIAILAPLINKPQSEDMEKLLVNQYKGIGEVLKNQALENVQLINDVTRKMQDVEHVGDNVETVVYEDEDEEEKTNLFTEIKPILDQFLPAMLQSGTANKVTTGLVKGTPLFKRVMKDRLTIRQLIMYLDSAHGVVQTDQLLQQLNIRRPGQKLSSKQAPVSVQKPKVRRKKISAGKVK